MPFTYICFWNQLSFGLIKISLKSFYRWLIVTKYLVDGNPNFFQVFFRNFIMLHIFEYIVITSYHIYNIILYYMFFHLYNYLYKYIQTKIINILYIVQNKNLSTLNPYRNLYPLLLHLPQTLHRNPTDPKYRRHGTCK